MVEKITPLILTYNEAPNIRRCLDQLRWAGRVVIVDSFSEDETLVIAARYPNVKVYQRKFDSHAVQWSFGLTATNISTEWVLALDADYILTEKLIDEIKSLNPDREITAYRSRFIYCVFGKPLRASLYPPTIILFRREGSNYIQDGHTQRLSINGKIRNLNEKVFHDDRKPLKDWLVAQDRYMDLEAHKLMQGGKELNLADCVRRIPFPSPFLVFFYCYFGKGLFLNGWHGFYYSLQRMTAETILSLKWIKQKLS